MGYAAPAWRVFLAEIIRDPDERKRLANELAVSEVTLGRWASREPGAPRPHLNNLYRLIEQVAPKHRETLIALLHQDFPDVPLATSGELLHQVKDVPALFYRRTLDAYTTIAQPYQRFWTISRLVLQQALAQLDPDYHGMVVEVMRCLPPPPQASAIRSVYRASYIASGLWKEGRERSFPLLLGAESLPGYVVATCQPAFSPQSQHEARLPIWPMEDEGSALAYPLLRHGRIAGALYAASVMPDFFTAVRRELLEQYSQLLSLAFDTADFFDPEQMRLGVFPRPHRETQQSYFASYRDQVSHQIAQTMGERKLRSLRDVEQSVLQAIEAAILDTSVGSPNRKKGDER